MRSERRVADILPEALTSSHSYTFALVILACVLLILVGVGVVLFVMLQP
jgi:hypothetical protein